MKFRTLRYQTFAEIADKTAKKVHGDWWRARRDDYLEALIQDHWFGRFMDNAGQSCVFDLDPRKAAHAPATITREAVWRLLGCYKPQTVREVPEGSPPPCKTLSAAKITEYGGTVVHDVFEILGLSEADAHAWGEENLPRVQSGPQHKSSAAPLDSADAKSTAVRPNRRGRKKGVGGYDSTDLPLIEEMHRLINSSKATSPSPAAHMVVHDARGTEDVPNKVKRLVKKYLTHYSPGGSHSL